MKTDPNEPATAQVVTSAYPEWNPNRHFGGLSIRELFSTMNFADGFSEFAAAAFDPEISSEITCADLLNRARLCCRGADALIAALNEEKV